MADFNHDNVLESNQGGRNSFLNGYSHIKKKTTATSVYWSCSEKGKWKCTGTLKTSVDLEMPVVSLH